MSEELIEKIARAMEKDHHGFPLWTGLAHETKDEWKAKARAALAAIECSGTHQVIELKPMQEIFRELAAGLRDLGLYEHAFRVLVAGGLAHEHGAARPKVTE